MGNQTDKANEQWVYDDRGRPVSYKLNGQLVATYQYNAHGQRTHRTIYGATTVTIHYIYNTAGQLIAQRRFDNGTAASDTDYIWIDSQPIAQIETPYQGNPATPDDANAVTTYLHTDQLNTPRIGSDSNQVIVWRWDSDAFGLGTPNEDPDGNSQTATVDLRFPGQIASDGGVYYNYFRDYDPSTGRYIESDPIGLNGGLNTYGYVGGSPVNFVDLYGLLPVFPPEGLDYTGEAIGGAGDFVDNYLDMRDAGWIGGDKYFHCKANCEATQRGAGGQAAACAISDTREWWDQYIKGYPAADSAADQVANQHGRQQGAMTSNGSCSSMCSPFRPTGLPPAY